MLSFTAFRFAENVGDTKDPHEETIPPKRKISRTKEDFEIAMWQQKDLRRTSQVEVLQACEVFFVKILPEAFAAHKTERIMMGRAVSRAWKSGIEKLPGVHINLSEQGSQQITSRFLCAFSPKITLSNVHKWGTGWTWLDSLIEAIESGLKLERLIVHVEAGHALAKRLGESTSTSIRHLQLILHKDRDMVTISGLKALAEVLEIDLKLSYTRMPCGDRLLSLAKFASIRRLDLRLCQIKNERAQVLGSLLCQMSSLVHVNLSDNILRDDGVEAVGQGLIGHTSLQTLDLRGCRFKAEGARALMVALEGRSSLMTLNLSGNELLNAGAKVVGAGLEGLVSLKTLELQSCGIKALGAKSLGPGLGWLSSLVILNLSMNKLGDQGAKDVIAGLGGLLPLHTLKLRSCQIEAEGAKTLGCALLRLPSLVVLDVSDNAIGDYGAKAVVAGLVGPASLQTLDLESCGIKSNGATALGAALGVLSSLENLKLRNNAIEDNGAKAVVAGLVGPASIQTLDLESCGIKSNGATALGAALGVLSSLVNLNLRSNHLNEDGWNAVLDGVKASASLNSLSPIDWLKKSHLNGSLVNLTAICMNGQNDGAVVLERVIERNASTLKSICIKLLTMNVDEAKTLGAALGGLSSLENLDLSDNYFQKEKVRALGVGLVRLSSLTTLKLGSSLGFLESKTLRALIEHNRVQVDNVDEDCQAPLHIAAREGDVDVVNALMEGKANVLAQNKVQAVVTSFFSSRAGLALRVESQMSDKISASVVWAVLMMTSHPSFFSSLNPHRVPLRLTPPNGKRLHLDRNTSAAQLSTVRMFMMSSNWGRPQCGETPILSAAKAGHMNVVQALMDGRANVLAKDKYGDTPILSAVNAGHMNVVRVLMDGRANVLAPDKNGLAPIHLAAKNGNVEAVRELLELKADVLAKDKDGFAAIHFADNAEAVRALILGKANVLAQDNKDGKAPIHSALESYFCKVEKLLALIECKADVLAKDNDGRTPVATAERHYNTECAKLLRQRGAE